MGSLVEPPGWVQLRRGSGRRGEGLAFRQVEWWDEIASTNTRALALGQSLAEEALPCLVGANRQTAGRGRGDHVWWSGPGALTLSLVVRPADWGWGTADDPCAAVVTATAVCRAVESVLPDLVLGLKWPNDIWCRGKKVAGLLVEPVPGWQGERRRLVIGLGLNINNALGAGPWELRELATSLREAAGAFVDEAAIGAALCREWPRVAYELAADRERLVAEWRSRCVLTGRRIAVQEGSTRTMGLCDGFADDGGLLVRTETTRVHLVAGTVELLPENAKPGSE
jgi:BirA family transcriptional regulator, biotin operon repressor / biotin---[acetyl-CoA-carboxylase] ligase